MVLFSKWQEIYITFDCNEFVKFANILEENNVDFKTKVRNGGIQPGSIPNVLGARANNSYTIWVKKDDVGLAKHLLNIF